MSLRSIGSRLGKVEGVSYVRSLHMIVCEDMDQADEAKSFLGDRFGDLLFVATGVPRGLNETERREVWLHQAKHNAVVGGPRP